MSEPVAKHSMENMFRSSLILLLLWLSFGCGKMHVKGEWEEPRAENAPYNNYLVVAFSSYDRGREALERRMLADLSREGAQAAASFRLDENKPLSREWVMAMASKTGADAVLVTRMLHHSVTSGQTKSEAYVNVGPQYGYEVTGNVTEYWAGYYSIHQTDSERIAISDLLLETAVYDVAENARVAYVISTKYKYKEDWRMSVEGIADDIADAIIKELRGAGLIGQK